MRCGRLVYLVALVMSATLGLTAAAQPLAVLAPPQLAPVPPPPAIAAPSYLLMDAASGRILASSAPDARVAPASLTKLMTAYVVFEALRDGRIRLDDQVPVSAKAWRMRGSRMFIEVNTTVAVEALLQGLIVQSGNDASVALAEHVAGSVEDFVASMNERAVGLGLRGTQFRNPTGLPARGHYSTASDLARLAQALIAEFPEHYYRYSQREFTFNSITQHNRNSLLWRDPSVDGLKTGYTADAGYCLVGAALRDGLRLIAVVLGSRSDPARDRAAQALIDYGFSHFERRRVFTAGEAVVTARVRQGAALEVALGPAEDLYVTLARGSHRSLETRFEIPDYLQAPVDAGAVQGRAQVLLGAEELAAVPLVVLSQVAQGGLWMRFKDGVEHWLE
jgi:D-alanyl-D-alanine carboxypeptidase (penicillin-binding protein 5/6)